LRLYRVRRRRRRRSGGGYLQKSYMPRKVLVCYSSALPRLNMHSSFRPPKTQQRRIRLNLG